MGVTLFSHYHIPFNSMAMVDTLLLFFSFSLALDRGLALLALLDLFIFI